MNGDLLKLVRTTDAYASLKAKEGHFVVDDTIGISLLFAALFKEKPANVTVIAANLYGAQKIADTLAPLVGEDNVLLFPSDDVLRSELLASSKEFLAQRLYVMGESLEGKPRILVAHAASIAMPLPPVSRFTASTFKLKLGDTIDLQKIRERLAAAGYFRVNRIDQSLQFASRGDILDISGVNSPSPVRIELFGDTIEKIAYFDIATQISGEKLNEVTIYPANQYLASDEEVESFAEKLASLTETYAKSLDSEKARELSDESATDLEMLKSRLYHPRLAKYYRLIEKDACSILDYFPSELVFIANEDQFRATSLFNVEEASRYLSALSNKGKLIPGLTLYLDVDDVLRRQSVLLYGAPFRKSDEDVEFPTRPVIFSRTGLTNLKDLIGSYLSLNDKVVLALSSKRQLDIVESLLKDAETPYEIVEGLSLPKKTKLGLALYSLAEGFELPEFRLSFISSGELFGRLTRPGHYFNRYKEGVILRSYEDLVPGDYVVHEHYGIGRFVKIETIGIEGVHRDFLRIAYRGDAILHVPLSQFRLVRKYAGREGASPKLSSLSSGDWEKTKKRIKERINELADRLYQLYTTRAEEPGFQFAPDDEFQLAFENDFPYELTDDQKRSLEETKKDMESPRVMDRLLAGDVGFGKTEVAFRAAFKAILSGKQAALLCPTTLLARQHYERALERFSRYGVRIAILSRLIPEKRQEEYIKGIAAGTIHLVIGTHRILSSEVVFKDLGLLIVDEEQRFGVEQKEKIKELKTDVDVLSLSATPIPRTLQLSLIGMRAVSRIETPPEDRNPIQTYVMPYRFEVAKELIERELARKGQVYYVHNTIAGIAHAAEVIRRSIPSASVGTVHGKMDKDEIEDTMMRFYQGRIDVLVATSIIENGIDVPNANLILIEDADKFGLAQLYQIKGRVGRSGRLAYAYLFYRPQKNMKEDARKRLKAIQDFVELGSGYKIAQRDLMIRGAGDLLGPEQAGFIDSIGLDLYLKMLSEVIEEKKTGVSAQPPKPVRLFNLDAYIPKNYVIDADKVEWYQEIENAPTKKDLLLVKAKMRDVYGRLPKEVELLYRKRALDIILAGEAFVGISEDDTDYIVTTSNAFSGINGVGVRLFEKLEPILDKIRLTYLRKVLQIKVRKEGDWLRTLEEVSGAIEDLYERAQKDRQMLE